MDGLLFLGTIIAVGLVMHWVVLNERIRKSDATTGMFAMRRSRNIATAPDDRQANTPHPTHSRSRRRQ